MFSYPQISRWLTFSKNPIAIEDWLANREYFGPEDNPTAQGKELETAFQIETLRQMPNSPQENLSLEVLLSGLDSGGSLKLADDTWVIVPMGKASVKDKVAIEIEVVGGTKKEKIAIAPVEIKTIRLDPAVCYKIRAQFKRELRLGKKNSLAFEMSGCQKLVIDSRGRPMTFLDGNSNRQRLLRWKGELNAH